MPPCVPPVVPYNSKKDGSGRPFHLFLCADTVKKLDISAELAYVYIIHKRDLQIDC